MENTYKVAYTTIRNIEKHPNADTLEIAVVYGFRVIVKKELYKIGDNIIYIPIDSIIPPKLTEVLFPKESAIKIEHNRIKQINIRKVVSQGLIVGIDIIKQVYGNDIQLELENDYSEILNIKKYVPKLLYQTKKSKQNTEPSEEQPLPKYNGITNINWYPERFVGQTVVAQEKIHGTNVRFGILNVKTNQEEGYKFMYGSNNVLLNVVDIENAELYKNDLYGSVLKKYDVFNKIKKNEIVYGEIYGKGIQKNYNYGTNEHKLIIFDVKVYQGDNENEEFRWLNPDEVAEYARERSFDMVPEIYRGIYDYDKLKQLTIGDSVLCPSQKVREGIVIKSLNNYSYVTHNKIISKNSLKMLSEEYLSKDQTDFQ